MKLIDLDVDCLESSLEHFSLEDLLKVASSNKRLNHAAKFIYSSRYRSKTVYFSVLVGNVKRPLQYDDDDLIYLNNLRMSLEFLRCFGHLLSNIEMYFSDGPVLIQYGGQNVMTENKLMLTHRAVEGVNEYCADTLTDIRFNVIQDFPEYLKKPFRQVKCIKIENCYLKKSFKRIWLNAIFPKLQELNLEFDCRVDYPCGSYKLIECHFKYLERFKIIVSPTYFLEWNDSEIIRLKENIMMAIHMNPQIKHLYMYTALPGFFGINDLQSINQNLNHLETLELYIGDEFYYNFNGEFVFFNNLKMLNLHMDKYNTMSIPFICDKLEILALQLVEGISDFEYAFMQKHPSITKIRLEGYHSLHAVCHVDMLKIAESLPNLERIIFDYRIDIRLNQILPHWSKFESLKEFTFELMWHVTEDNLVPFMINGWSASISIFGSKSEINLRRNITQEE